MSHPDEHLKTEPEHSRPEEVSRLRDALARSFAGCRARISSPGQPGGPRGRTAARGSGAASRLIPLVVTAAMALSLVVVSAAPASPAVGGHGNSEQGKPKLHRALARLVLSPAPASIRAGATLAYTAEGYDAAGHDLGDVTARTRFSISPDGSCAGATCTASERGQHTVTGTVHRGNRAISGRAALQVVVPPGPAKRSHRPAKASHRPAKPSHGPAKPSGGVHPRGGPVEPVRGVQLGRDPVQALRQGVGRPRPVARLVLSPARTFILSGERVTYTAEAYDAAGHDLGDVTAETTFSITFSAAGSFKARPDGACTGATCTATKFGRHTVTGTADLGNGTTSGTAALQVVPRHRGAGLLQRLASLELHPKSAVIESGAAISYIAYGYDADHHFLGDVTTFTVFSINPDGSCTGATCTATATQPLVHTVTGTVRVKNRQVTGTAALLVAPRLAGLDVEPQKAVVEVRHSVNYTAYGLDANGHRVVDLTAYTEFFMSQPGSCTGAICIPTETGIYVVTGNVNLGDRTISGKARLRVIPAITSLGLYPGSATIKAGDKVTYDAKGLDEVGRPVVDLTADTVFSISAPGSCTGATCTATKAQVYKVTGTVQLVDRTISGTAILDVVPGPLAKLTLDPPQATIAAGGKMTYRAYGSDAYGNPLGEVTAKTTFTISPDGSCTGATCTATSAQPRQHTVTGTIDVGNQQVSGTAILDVVPGPLAKLTLDPPQATIAAGGKMTYRAYGSDAYGNPLGEVTAKTRFSISPDGSCTGATCTVPGKGDYTVTGTVAVPNGQITGTATLHVVGSSGPVRPPIISLQLSPQSAAIDAGGSVTYTATGSDRSRTRQVKLTARTHLSISPDGSCTGATCTASQLGPHTVTGTVNLGNRIVTGRAHLLVVSRMIVSLRLNPRSAVIHADGKVTYTATGLDSAHRAVVDLTDYTSFSISPDGSCTGATCTASKPGAHTVTGTVNFLSRIINGKATVQVLPRRHHALPPLRLASLELNPKSALVDAGAPITYIAIGIDANGTRLGDLTADTRFSISPDGSCTHATCTAGKPGPHTITGTVERGTHFGDLTAGIPLSIGPDGSCTHASCTAAKPGPDTITGSVSRGNRRVTGTARLQVMATSPDCVPSASDVHGLRVLPRRGAPGTSIRIEGKLDRRFAGCPLVLLLGGARLGGDTTVGPRGSVSGRGTVSSHANRGTSTVTLATIDGRTLAVTSFEILPGSKSGWLLWLLLAIAALLLAALGAAAIGSERARRQRRWVRQHVRAEPHSHPGQVSTDPDRDAPPTFTVRLQPHADTGTTEITKEGD
jgi:hypothetical protein